MKLVVQDKHLHFYFSKNLILELVFVHVMETNTCQKSYKENEMSMPGDFYV